MKEQDLNNILIKESEFYVRGSLYANFLKKNNINTVKELLDGKFDGRSFNGHKMQGKTFGDLQCFISLLRYKYLGEPLWTDVYLNQSIDMKRTRDDHCGGKYIYFFEPVVHYDFMHLSSFFATEGCNLILLQFIAEMEAYNNNQKENNLPVKDVKVIDFFNWILSKKSYYPNLVPFAELYVNQSKKENEIIDDNPASLEILKKQLVDLMKIRSDLDTQIENIKQEIEKISNDELKGGIAK